jgi:glycerol-1-phosphate dehydrogenase [NAD(P)+]
LNIPRYIFIGDTRNDTKRAFEHVLEKTTGIRVLIVSSSLAEQKVEWLSAFLDSLNVEIVRESIDKDDAEAVQAISAAIAKSRSSMCLGIGGGRILDVAKFASFTGNIPFVSFPTLLSHDGIASPVAVIPDGKHWSESRTAASPFGVIIDLKTVAGAPVHSILSGISDLTANLFASLDIALFSNEHTDENDTLSMAIARSAALLVFPGFEMLPVDSLSTEQMKHLAWGLVLSGIAMSISGSSKPASGAEHKISHAIDYLFPVPVSHGFTVAVGNVVSAFLHERYQREIIRFNSALGLPVVSDDIGMEKKDFAKAIRYARKIRPDRYTILEEKNLTEGEIRELLERIEAEKENTDKAR